MFFCIICTFCTAQPQGLVCTIRNNVKCYYNAVVQINNIDIIISTLWAKIPLEDAYPTERGVNDFHRILYNDKFFINRWYKASVKEADLKTEGYKMFPKWGCF